MVCVYGADGDDSGNSEANGSQNDADRRAEITPDRGNNEDAEDIHGKISLSNLTSGLPPKDRYLNMSASQRNIESVERSTN